MGQRDHGAPLEGQRDPGGGGTLEPPPSGPALSPEAKRIISEVETLVKISRIFKDLQDLGLPLETLKEISGAGLSTHLFRRYTAALRFLIEKDPR